MTSDRILALELIRENAVKFWRETLGPTDSNTAKIEAPGSIRAKWGKDKTYNAAHGSDSQSSAARVRLGKYTQFIIPNHIQHLVKNSGLF